MSIAEHVGASLNAVWILSRKLKVRSAAQNNPMQGNSSDMVQTGNWIGTSIIVGTLFPEAIRIADSSDSGVTQRIPSIP